MRKVIGGFCLNFLMVLLSALAGAAESGIPDGFVYVATAVPDAVLEVRYYGENNFVGERIDGYLAPKVILTRQAASALAGVQAELRPFGLGLKLFDGYRPQRAVDHFVRWAADLSDTRNKSRFYPGVDKKNLFRDGYIAAKSGHSRGSTIDLTIVDSETGDELDMGTPFDFFGPKSWPKNAAMSAEVRSNRALLRSVMERHGFKPYEAEWWHFTLAEEPHPDTYFDFPVQ
ncbi:M15 family metallopeptidase [Salidesulfovibrio brasiliensis]|uniref:M15 family metallopeptidase n=1 Tax=Salidesulfovibrio brasiliensis TaxID=221711 RepID=UPI0006D0A231|nr:M15 family metallopeptidase [Salidesulfovibrio brasiliensis]